MGFLSLKSWYLLLLSVSLLIHPHAFPFLSVGCSYLEGEATAWTEGMLMSRSYIHMAALWVSSCSPDMTHDLIWPTDLWTFPTPLPRLPGTPVPLALPGCLGPPPPCRQPAPAGEATGLAIM